VSKQHAAHLHLQSPAAAAAAQQAAEAAAAAVEHAVWKEHQVGFLNPKLHHVVLYHCNMVNSKPPARQHDIVEFVQGVCVQPPRPKF
jgi:hypothetical protein